MPLKSRQIFRCSRGEAGVACAMPLQAVLRLDPGETLEGENSLYFQQPEELLELFNKLECENLSLIQECQQVLVSTD